ncbi:Hypothetical protein I596_112 [Dokdonella koreensis DS-123]|uniref:Uncharacterized protein n=1 Tax=Dokdonella koreensis DS-123 TaxID=1300342 RepID=A0A167G4M2_9GAMM|nr:Hypothetical protein I596_112 [Dokdonella koreensis DS-123]
MWSGSWGGRPAAPPSRLINRRSDEKPGQPVARGRDSPPGLRRLRLSGPCWWCACRPARWKSGLGRLSVPEDRRWRRRVRDRPRGGRRHLAGPWLVRALRAGRRPGSSAESPRPVAAAASRPPARAA